MTTPDRGTPRTLTLDDFDFPLPSELIAQYPLHDRSGARLLDGTQDTPIDRVFQDLPSLLRPGDLMVCNDTRVMRARLVGEKPTGGQVEILVDRLLGGREIAAQMRVSKKPRVGTEIRLTPAHGCQDNPTATLLGCWPDEHGAMFRLALSNDAGDDPGTLIDRHGRIPLPPYITRPATMEDATRYQTVFASKTGAVAAPTAALHFDHALLAEIDAAGIQRAHITLHVGSGTFTPVRTNDLTEHRMHGEWYEVPLATQKAILECRERGARVVAVGTTTVRALESWGRSAGDTSTAAHPSGETHIFITPGFRFRMVDMLVTNFHLPKSSLLMLVSAFAGHEHIMALYRHAIAHRYRFFSYGDAMLLRLTPPGCCST